ncbi:Uncharacterised protein [uncultured archaeon]|nr:Uncharacterised protein [uncultured archaeon]
MHRSNLRWSDLQSPYWRWSGQHQRGWPPPDPLRACAIRIVTPGSYLHRVDCSQSDWRPPCSHPSEQLRQDWHRRAGPPEDQPPIGPRHSDLNPSGSPPREVSRQTCCLTDSPPVSMLSAFWSLRNLPPEHWHEIDPPQSGPNRSGWHHQDCYSQDMPRTGRMLRDRHPVNPNRLCLND